MYIVSFAFQLGPFGLTPKRRLPSFISQAKIHDHYIEHTMNPFAKLEGPIESESFRRKVEREVESFNR